MDIFKAGQPSDGAAAVGDDEFRAFFHFAQNLTAFIAELTLGNMARFVRGGRYWRGGHATSVATCERGGKAATVEERWSDHSPLLVEYR
ncbi:hypothetical protein ACFOQJ_02575 [Corynebacterium tuscaniense]|uniref:hypothetical protein n=1 Tax=Corynebacterium tuscaniense TaxID=302449 RepID=UPI0020123C09|nr:hypothetical protein [Corynebacterium tuscaniense]